MFALEALAQRQWPELRPCLGDPFIRGQGVEVGAGLNPVYHKQAERTDHVDIRDVEQLASLLGTHLPYPLSTWGDVRRTNPCGVEFVTAHHVLEHAADPIGTLVDWISHLRIGGVLYLSIPSPGNTTELRRPLTPIRHLLEDHFFARTSTSYESKAHIPTFVMSLAKAEDHMKPWYTTGTGPALAYFLLEELAERDDHDCHWHTLTLETAREMGLIAFHLAKASGAELLAYESDDSLYLAWRKGAPGPTPKPLRNFRDEMDAVSAHIRSLESGG
jgi:hypothetical protein